MTLRGVIVSIIMTIVLSIMVLGYAALQQRIDIEAEATVDSTYKVQINSVKEKSTTGDARSTSVFQYNGLSTTFHVGLTNTNDSITYEIELNNLGTVDAILNNTEVLIDGSNNMKVVRLGVKNGDILLANSLKVLTITVKLTEVTSSEQTANITINLDYTRLKGGTGEVVPEVYPTYQIGDKITFAGSEWYVIEDSGENQDYVTVLKEKALTVEEVNTYGGVGTDNNHVNRYTPASQGIAYNQKGYGGIAYYSSETCGYYESNPYTSAGCKSNYNDSDIKYIIDNYASQSSIYDNLKEIDGYKARLINWNDLQNIGYEYCGGQCPKNDSVPNWVYAIEYDYWTMEPYNSGNARIIQTYNGQVAYGVHTGGRGNYLLVRPVINLYKDVIE